MYQKKRKIDNAVRTEILKGSIIKALLKLAWPVMVGNLMHTAYNLADTFWLGRLGKEALAAPTISWPLIWLVISLSDGIGIAGTALVAQHTGAGNYERANRVAGQVLAFVFVVASILAVTGVIFAHTVLKWMGAEPGLLERATSYSRVIFAGIPLMFGFFVFGGLLRGVGDTITPMKLGVVSVILNLVLDPLLIFGVGFFPRLEVSGAAIATVFSRGVATIIAGYLLFTGKVGIKIKLSYLKLRITMIKKIISVGVPSSIGSSGSAMAFTLLMKIMARFGTTAVSAYGVGNRVLSILWMPIFGLAASTTTMVGQNLGADQVDRARRVVWTSTGVVSSMMAIGGIICLVLRKTLVRIFIDDPAVIELGAIFFTIMAFSIPFFAIIRIMSSAFQGSGHTFYSMGFSLFRLWVLLLPSAYFVSVVWEWGPKGVWWSFVWSNILTAGIAIVFFVKGVWEEKVIEKE